jgi:hypothetical protein
MVLVQDSDLCMLTPFIDVLMEKVCFCQSPLPKSLERGESFLRGKNNAKRYW